MPTKTVTKKTAVKKTVKATVRKEPAAKAKKVVEAPVADTGEDLYIVLNGVKHQFSSQISAFYDVKEFFFKGTFTKGDSIKFVRGDNREVPVHTMPNCGFTLIGKAQRLISASKALVANGEAGDDQEYVYINDHSTLTFVGDTSEHTLFLRVYDNISGIENDRWAVLYID